MSTAVRIENANGRRRTVPLLFLFLVTMLGAARCYGAQSVTLAWNPNSETNLAGYKLFYGTAPRNYSGFINVGSGTTTGTVPNLLAGQTYFFAVTAYCTDGLESDYSAEVSYLVTGGGANQAPVANAASVFGPEDQAIAVVLTGSDADGDPLTYTLTAAPNNGSVSGTAPNLTYTPSAGFFGSDSLSFRVNDGKTNSAPATITITVNAVNDAPTLASISNVTLNEDAGAQTVNLSGIGTGAANESQALTVTATSSNPTLVPNPTVNYASPNATGSLSFTPAANANGSATITVTVNDGQAQNNTASRTFTVTVNSINDAPTLAALGNVNVNEDAGAQPVSLNGISSGASGENQNLTVTASSSNPTVVPNPTVNYASPNGTGNLTFTPVANANGTATITVTVNDGQAQNNLTTQTFTITVNSVNDAPTLNSLSNLSLPLNAGAQTVNLSGIGSGAANESQTLTVTAVSSNPSLVPNPAVTYASPNATGSLRFTPVGGASGTATITVTVDDGQALNNVTSRTFTISVAANQPPTLGAINNRSINEDALAQSVNLSGIGSGSASENQTLTVTATSSNPSLIPHPTVSYASPNTTGSLSFTPVADANGSATITVTVDDGQSANNSFSRIFTVTVNAVNDAPDLASIGNLSLSEDPGLQAVNLSGIGTGAANESQTLTVTASSSNPGLIPNPTVTYVSPNATGSLSFTPVANGNGSATITVTVNDGQSQNNTVSRTFTVTVGAVNDGPTLAALGNVTINEDTGVQTVSLSGIGAGAGNESQPMTVTATSSNPGLVPNPTVNYSSPNATGSLNFTPVANGNGSATITVTVNDGQAQNNTVSQTFLVTVNPVNDTPTLNGLSNLSLAQNASLQTVNLSGIGSGAANESQALIVSAVSSNPGLVPNPSVNYASPNATGSLSFTPVAGAGGTATITVTVDDGQAQNNTVSRNFTVSVAAGNQLPTLGAINNRSINEDAAVQSVSLSGIGSGSASENQTLTVTATSSNPSLIPNPTVSYASPNTTGSLSFTPVANGNGSATITVTVNDGQAQNNTVSQTFLVTVNPVNDAPTLNVLSNLSLAQDAGLQTVNLSGIGSGAANESQALIVSVVSSNPGLVPNPSVNYASPNATGSLSFTPVAGAGGTATITVTVDDGQAQNNTVSRNFTVSVAAGNQLPTLGAISNRSINEDATVQSVSLSGIGSGSASEYQTLTVTAISSDPSLIPHPTVSYASPNTTGSLSFTPVADANGSATITVTVDDGQSANNSFSRTFTVTVNAVNDAPDLASIGNLSLSEDPGLQAVNLSGIGTGAANESQTLTVTASSSNPGLIPNPTVTYVSPNATGSLSFTPVANGNGSATITVTVNDGQSQNNTVSRTFTVTVGAVNDGPTLASLGNVTINEDAGVQTVSLSGIGAGAGNESQPMTVTATSSNPGLVPNPTVNYSSPNATGSLNFTPVANGNGSATITVTVNDGQAQNNTVSQTFLVTVNPVNDTPTLNGLSNLSLAQNAGLQTMNLSGIGSGAANESQALIVSAVSSNPGLVPNPSVNYASPNATGSLSFTPVAGAGGTATITVTVDDGQAQNNTVSRNFTVSVASGNQPPTINPIGDIVLSEDAQQQLINLSGISAGGAESQTLTVTATSSNPSLIPTPTLTYASPASGGSLTFLPARNGFGTATITVTVDDGQPVSSTTVRTFLVTVNPVNDVPTLGPIADVDYYEDTGSHVIQLTGISTGASNELQTLTISATSSDPSVIPNPQVNYSSPGTTGTLTLNPVTDVVGSAVVTVTLSDGGSAPNQVIKTFAVAIRGLNDPPAISQIEDQFLDVNEATGPIPFTLVDVDTSLSSVGLTVMSSDTILIPPSGLVLGGGSGINRTLSITPAVSRAGTSHITMTATDGYSTNTMTFKVVVGNLNAPPVISPVPDQTIDASTTLAEVPFTVSDAETPATELVVTATSYNKLVVPDSGIVLQGNGDSRKISVTPAPGKSGQVAIGVIVSDGNRQSQVSFQVTVLPPKSKLTVKKKGKGNVEPDLDGQTLNVGEAYTMTAIPDVDQVFSSWSGDANSTSEVLTFIMQSNMVIEANFEADPFILAQGTYSGLLAEADEVRHERSGNFTLTSTSRGTYTGKFQIGRSKVTVKGLLAIDGKATNVVARPGLTPLTLEVALEVGDTPGHMTGRVTDGSWTARLLGDRKFYNSKTNPAPFAGNFTMVVPSDGQNGPMGSGYGTVKVDGNGVATFVGMMADGTKAAQKVSLSRVGNWPFYLGLYKGGGAVLGWLAVTNDDIGGLVSWIKPAMVCKYYTEGLTNEAMVVGAAYRAPSSSEQQGGGVRRVDVICSGANLGEAITAELMMLPNGKMTTKGDTFNFGISPTTGLFKGTVLNSATGKPHSFGGVMLQKWNVGSGLVFGTNQVGLIEVSQQ